ncbi:hypothetical protein DFH09DRAFT_1383097 [Mycena vulgaris]|nr:hypothetical protein DFH09DRAFT_1383097 [Mycena vulgaris]
MSETSPSFPDEIVSEILSPALRVSDDRFSDNSSASPFAIYSESSSAILLVCKAWLRVGTPLLYNDVILRSKAQVKALCQTLSKNRELGRFIKKLRIEGGYSPSMRGILQNAPNILDIFLSLEIWSTDGTSGLCEGLPLINPLRVILRDSTTRHLNNKMLENLIDTLAKCIPRWDHLQIFDLPNDEHGRSDVSRIVHALGKSPSLQKITIPNAFQYHLPWIASTLKDTQLRVIEIKEPISPTWIIIFLKSLESYPTLQALVKYTEEHLTDTHKDSDNTTTAPFPHITPFMDPGFTPMESASEMVRDDIWRRILYYAMSVPELEAGIYPKDVPPRLALLLVSKTFYKLGIPHYYVHAQLKTSEAIWKFRSLLLKNTSIGSPDSIANILPLTTGLEQFHGRNQLFHHAPIHLNLGYPRLTWTAFQVLVKSSGSTLREFSSPVQATQSQPPAIFNYFEQLRSLDWKCCTTFDCSSPTTPSSGLNNLTDLRIWYLDPTFLTALMTMQLLSLRRLALSRSVSHPAAFFQIHGGKISELDVTYRTLQDLGITIFELCPNLSFISIYFDAFESVPPIAADFALHNSVHHHLAKVKFDLKPISTKDLRDWGAIFSVFEPTHFPNLREIEVKCFSWPTTE